MLAGTQSCGEISQFRFAGAGLCFFAGEIHLNQDGQFRPFFLDT